MKHHEREEECVLMKNAAKKAWNKVPRGIVWFQVGAGFSLESDAVFVCITGKKADFF